MKPLASGSKTGVMAHDLIGMETVFWAWPHYFMELRRRELLSCLKNFMCYEWHLLTSLEMFERFVLELIWEK